MASRARLVVGVLALVVFTGTSVAANADAPHAGGARTTHKPASAQQVGGARQTTPGLDVSAYQHGVDWGTASGKGARFAYIKATEGDDYTNARLTEQYNAAAAAGLSRGAFHFATPNVSDGVVQATYFVDSLAKLDGGRVDGTRTLPPLLDLEPNPYVASDGTNTCWGLTPKQMVRWISQFTDTVIGLTDRSPVIYTSTSWWKNCTGDTTAFSGSPLFLARYVADPAVGAGDLPSAWSKWTIWQYTNAGTRYSGVADRSKGSVPARDEDVFRGSLADVQALARSTFSGGVGLQPARATSVLPGGSPQ